MRSARKLHGNVGSIKSETTMPDDLPAAEEVPADVIPDVASAPAGREPPPPGSLGDPSDELSELVAKKKALVESLDQIVEPLDAILALIRSAWRGGVLLLAFMALMVAVQVHTTLRMAYVQTQLEEVVTAQKTLQATATQVADKQTATQDVLNQQSQITIEPGVSPDGSPTAIVVVKPPPASSSLPAVGIPIAAPVPTAYFAPIPKPIPKPKTVATGKPTPPAPAVSAAAAPLPASAPDAASAPAPAPAPAPAAIKFE